MIHTTGRHINSLYKLSVTVSLCSLCAHTHTHDQVFQIWPPNTHLANKAFGPQPREGLGLRARVLLGLWRVNRALKTITSHLWKTPSSQGLCGPINFILTGDFTDTAGEMCGGVCLWSTTGIRLSAVTDNGQANTDACMDQAATFPCQNAQIYSLVLVSIDKLTLWDNCEGGECFYNSLFKWY